MDGWVQSRLLASMQPGKWYAANEVYENAGLYRGSSPDALNGAYTKGRIERRRAEKRSRSGLLQWEWMKP